MYHISPWTTHKISLTFRYGRKSLYWENLQQIRRHKVQLGGLTFWNLIELHWFIGLSPQKSSHGGRTIYFWREFCIFADPLHSKSSWWHCCDMVKFSCVPDGGGMLKGFFKRLTNFLFEVNYHCFQFGYLKAVGDFTLQYIAISCFSSTTNSITWWFSTNSTRNDHVACTQ